MKTGSLATKLMLAAILLTVLVYFGVNMAAYFMDPFTTTLAYGYTSEHAVTVSGYTVREEEVLSGGGELVYFSRREGERVSAGGTVALIYPNAQALENANQLRSLEQQLEQLLYAQSLAAGAQTSQRLDEDIESALVKLHSALSKDDLTAAGNAGDTLRANLLKRSYTYAGTGDLDSAISNLQSQIAALSAAADPGTARISAPRSGLFSGLVDGYESVLRPELISTLTPKDLRTLTPTAPAGSVGKMIYGSQWSFVTLIRSREIDKLLEGDTVTLRFQNGLDLDLPMTVEYISQEEGGQRVVALSSNQHADLTTLLRHQNAQVIFDSYTGIRVPRSAVRILTETVTDENGQELAEKTTGVYTVWGTSALFKPVEVVWSEEDYLLVRPAEGASAKRLLRAGDEVITAAEDLYDGKVVF